MSIFQVSNIRKDKSEPVKENPIISEDQVDLNNIPEESKEEGPTIILDGPLSQIYTQALNTVYAKEGMMDFVGQFKDLKKEDQYERLDSANAYIYCCHGDNLDNSEVTKISNRLMEVKSRLREGTEIIVSVESGRIVNGSIGLLRDFSKSLGASVRLTRESALTSIKVAVEGMSK